MSERHMILSTVTNLNFFSSSSTIIYKSNLKFGKLKEFYFSKFFETYLLHTYVRNKIYFIFPLSFMLRFK
jgi:hypothetical protein